MALDPRALKAGDVVVFGGNVELTVYVVSLNHVEWKDVIRATYFDEPFWKIAELKKPTLPICLNHYDLVFGDVYTLRTCEGRQSEASDILRWLKQDVRLLEEAGV